MSWRWARSITASSLAAHLSATSRFGAALALGEAALVVGCPDALGSSSAVFVFAVDVDRATNVSSVRAEPSCRLTHAGERLGSAVTLQTHPSSMITTIVAGRPDGTTPGVHAWRFSTPPTGSSGSSAAPTMACVEMNSVTGFKMSATDETATAIGYGDETLHFAAPKAVNSDLGVPGMDGRLYISKFCFPNRERHVPNWWYWHIINCQDCGDGKYSAGGHDQCKTCPAAETKPANAAWLGGSNGCKWRCNAGFATANCTACALLGSGAFAGGLRKPENFSRWEPSPGALECAWQCDTYSALSPTGDLCLPPLPPAVHVDTPRVVAVNHSVVELAVNTTARSEDAARAPVLGYRVEFYDRRFNLTGSRSVALAPLAASGVVRLRVAALWGDTPYTFRVAAYNIGGVGRWSNASLGELSVMYRYMFRESCSQFDSLPLTSLTLDN